MVIGGGRKNLASALIHPFFACPDFTDAGEEFVEVIGQLVAAFQAVVVECETFHDIFAQSLGSPLPETGGDRRFDSVADGDDHIQIVVIQRMRFFPPSVWKRMISERPSGCLSID